MEWLGIVYKVFMGLFVMVYVMWVSYVKGWSDSCDGTGNKVGLPDDMWHIVTRWLEYYPSLLSVPVGMFVGCFVGWEPLLGAVPSLVTARLWFRWGVHENGKYRAWYGVEFTVLGALYRD